MIPDCYNELIITPDGRYMLFRTADGSKCHVMDLQIRKIINTIPDELINNGFLTCSKDN